MGPFQGPSFPSIRQSAQSGLGIHWGRPPFEDLMAGVAILGLCCRGSKERTKDVKFSFSPYFLWGQALGLPMAIRPPAGIQEALSMLADWLQPVLAALEAD